MPSELTRPSDISMTPGVAAIFRRVKPDLAPTDSAYAGNDSHYWSVGASALNVITACLQLAGSPKVTKILDFRAGAGRVTRWLRAAFPTAEIVATDLRSEDMDFCAAMFGARTWVSTGDINELASPDDYDLIWAGSVLTHLTASDAEVLLRKFLSWTNPGGVVVTSTHGRYAYSRQAKREFFYIDAERFAQIEADYARAGYGYADFPGETGYGISLTRLDWLADLAARLPSCRLVSLSEKAWDNHHDIVALMRTE